MGAKVHNCVHKSAPLVSIQGKMNADNALPSHLFKIHFNTILQSSFRSSSQVVLPKLFSPTLYVFFFQWLYSPCWALAYSSGSWSFLQTIGLLGRVISSSKGLYLNTGQHKHRINIYTHQRSMPSLGVEPTIQASERAKTVHALDRSATVTFRANEDSSCLRPLGYRDLPSERRQFMP
jgi:hypothetical protein